MSTHSASGTFDVDMTPQAPQMPGTNTEIAGIGRMSLTKRFQGSLEATSRGEMIAFRSATPGSAGYVAMEIVQGILDGRAGSFVLQHSSTMSRGSPMQSIKVVPDSGTESLSGLAGSMIIDIAADRTHSYRFEYTLPDGS